MPFKGHTLTVRMCEAAKNAGADAALIDHYQPCDVLVLYGMGGANRLPPALRHMSMGKTLVSWDVGYWGRVAPLAMRKYRVSINGFHPNKYVMQGPYPGPDRWNRSGLQITQSGDPNGPILLIGNGPKSNAVGARGWTFNKLLQLRKAFPDRPIVYRPKPKRPPESGIVCDAVSGGPIEDALAGASLVVCRHSNVAVDACRMGVPVVCDDGAAAAIYPQSLADAGKQPSTETRREFLHRLAWWQWSMDEAPDAWRWLSGVLDATVQ